MFSGAFLRLACACQPVAHTQQTAFINTARCWNVQPRRLLPAAQARIAPGAAAADAALPSTNEPTGVPALSLCAAPASAAVAAAAGSTPPARSASPPAPSSMSAMLPARDQPSEVADEEEAEELEEEGAVGVRAPGTPPSACPCPRSCAAPASGCSSSPCLALPQLMKSGARHSGHALSSS